MIASIIGDPSAKIDINSRKSIIAIVYLAVIGPCVFILTPGFVQGLVQYLGMTEQHGGLIASAEMFGLATTTVLLSFVAARVSWRKFLAVCILISTAGNLASIGQTDPNTLAVIRFVTGLGSGGMISLTFTMMGLTARADRNFGYIIVWVLTYGALGLFVMPTAYSVVGMNGVFVFFALFCLSGLWFLRSLPDSGEDHHGEAGKREYKAIVRRLTLLAILIYNVSINMVWAFLFLVGVDGGMAEQSVANALTISQFLGIAGAFLAVIFEVRLGRLLPLMIGVLGGAGSIYFLVGRVSATDYWIAVCGFNFLWNLSMPYMLATLADFDPRGQTVVHGVSMQFVGYAIGPYLGAMLLTRGGYDLVYGGAVALFVISAVVILPGVLAQRKFLRNA